MDENVVRVPKPSRSSYNPDRPLEKNALVQAHVAQLHHVEMQLPPEQRTGIDISTIKTEGQAAEYIKRVTLILHPAAPRVKRAT